MSQTLILVILPIFAGAICMSVNQLLRRTAMKTGDFSTLQFTATIFGSATIVFALFYITVWGFTLPNLLPKFWNVVWGGALANVLIQFLNAKAASIDKGEVSLTAPLQSMTPGLITGLGIILGEWPGKIGVAGIFFMAFGSYFLLCEKDPKTGKYNYAGPVKRLRFLLKLKTLSNDERNKTLVVCMALGSACAGTIGLLFDGLVARRGIDMQGLILGAASLTAILSAAYFVWYAISPDGTETQRKNGWKKLFAIPSALSFAGLVIIAAFGIIWVAHVILIQPIFTREYVAYVGTLKRLSVPISVFMGYMIFGEGDFKKRIWASFLIFTGATLISMDGLPARIGDKISGFGF